MALFNCNFISDTLRMSTSMSVILPQDPTGLAGKKVSTAGEKFPVLYLLHGFGGDHTTILRFSSIEKYVASLKLAVVMPSFHRSFYCNMKNGYNYWTFLMEELPYIARSFFPLSEKREDNFVAGESAGGYGALKLALSCPENFAAAGSIFGGVDMANFRPDTHEIVRDACSHQEFHNIFGDFEKIAGGENDLFHLAEKLAGSGQVQPKIFQCCGTEDFVYPHNLRFRDHLRKLDYDLTYDEGPGGHDWIYADNGLKKIIDWLPLNK